MNGNRIKMLREKKNLKQDELAEILNVSPSAIGMYERNEREPNDIIKIKLANYFNVSIDYLLGETDIPDKQPDTVRFAFANTSTEGLKDEDIEDINRYIEMRKQLAKERKEKK